MFENRLWVDTRNYVISHRNVPTILYYIYLLLENYWDYQYIDDCAQWAFLWGPNEP